MKKNVDLIQEYNLFEAPLDALNSDAAVLYDPEDIDLDLLVSGNDIEDFDKATWVEFDYTQLVEDLFAEIDPEGIYYGYLIYNDKANWQNNSAYKLTEDLTDLVNRDYDFSLYFLDKYGDISVFRESSHDVPMGGTIKVIGIQSEEEYGYLDDYEREFKDIEEYIDMIEELNSPNIVPEGADEEDLIDDLGKL